MRSLYTPPDRIRITHVTALLPAPDGTRLPPLPLRRRNGPADALALQTLSAPAAARGGSLLLRGPAADGAVGHPVPRLGHLCARQLYRARPADQGRGRLREGRRRAQDAPPFQGA